MERGGRRPSVWSIMVVAALVGGPAGAMPPQAASQPMALRPPPKAQLVDINSASVAELKTLPGVGDKEAARIVAARPYRSKAMLVEKGALDETQFGALKRHVIAIQKLPPPKPKP